MKSIVNPVLPELEVWQEIADVRIWRFSLDCDATAISKFWHWLDAQERIRANRLINEQLRSRFVVARAKTRIILAAQLGNIDPRKVKFMLGTHGKPSVSLELHFNLSHSHDLALLAVSRIGEVGIDIEQISRDVEVEDIANRFFTPDECSEMMFKSGSSRTQHFFDLWCCKEAYLKAVGVGISGGLNKCRILDAVDGTASVYNPSDPEAARRWRIHRLNPANGFAGALCVSSIGECVK